MKKMSVFLEQKMEMRFEPHVFTNFEKAIFE